MARVTGRVLADGSEGPARVAMLLRQNSAAGKAFCASLCHAAPAEQVAELIAALRDHLLSSAPASEGATAAAAVASKGSKRCRGKKQGGAVASGPEQGDAECLEVQFSPVDNSDKAG